MNAPAYFGLTPRLAVLALLSLAGTGVVRAQTESGGTADITLQGYYLAGESQPVTALSGLNIAFREFLPGLGLLNGNIEGYDETTRGRVGQNFVTLNDLKWKQRRWTITGGDFRLATAMVPVPFTNYSFPELGLRGAKVSMSDGTRQYSMFWGQETLQEGPRITFRVDAPQDIAGASVHQDFGEKLHVGVRYLDYSSSEQQVAANPLFFPPGSEYRRTDTLSAQTSYTPWSGLSLFTSTDLSRVEFADIAVYPHSVPFSWLGGAKWTTKRLTVTANYGSLSRSALPAVGYYFGDRRGPFAEIRYKLTKSLDVYINGTRSSNNIEKDPLVPNLTASEATAGATAQLPWKFSLSGDYSILGVAGFQASDATQDEKQTNKQLSVILARTVRRHTLTATARDLTFKGSGAGQLQKSFELQDSFQYSRFSLTGAARLQEASIAGAPEQSSLFVRANGQMRFRRFTIYGQFETGNDLVAKSLFSTSTTHTTVAGVSFPLPRGWSGQAEAFRTTVVTALNPLNILVLQSQGDGVSDILNDFNQWSFYFRLTHQTHWGAALLDPSNRGAEPIYGSIEGFVYDGATGSKGEPGVSVSLDKSRTTISDVSGRYRFEDVPEGRHSVELDMAELPADRSPGPLPPPFIAVRPRRIARVDLRVVDAGSAIQGHVQGIAKEDEGVVRLEGITFRLAPTGGMTDTDNSGAFGFFNLEAGRYNVTIDTDTIPEGYVLDSEPEVVVSIGEGAAPPVTYRIRKKPAPVVPVRKVFDGRATGTN
jgi:hypothetical protein